MDSGDVGMSLEILEQGVKYVTVDVDIGVEEEVVFGIDVFESEVVSLGEAVVFVERYDFNFGVVHAEVVEGGVGGAVIDDDDAVTTELCTDGGEEGLQMLEAVVIEDGYGYGGVFSRWGVLLEIVHDLISIAGDGAF